MKRDEVPLGNRVAVLQPVDVQSKFQLQQPVCEGGRLADLQVGLQTYERWGKPYVFYSTDEKGRIYRVSKSKLDKETIEKQFENYLNGPHEKDPKPDMDVQLMRVLPLDDSRSKNYKIEFDYLNIENLHEELNSFNDKKLLQAFIRPKNGKNRRPWLTRI